MSTALQEMGPPPPLVEGRIAPRAVLHDGGNYTWTVLMTSAGRFGQRGMRHERMFEPRWFSRALPARIRPGRLRVDT
ncbi:hypothetical protein ACWDNI_29145, partial [Nocardia niigatensis]